MKKILFTTLTLFAITSCSKNENSVPNGAAYDYHSETIFSNDASWIYDSTENSYNADLPSTLLTQDRLDNYSKGFFRTPDWNNPLPDTLGWVIYSAATYELFSVKVKVYSLLPDSIPDNPGALEFFLVVMR